MRIRRLLAASALIAASAFPFPQAGSAENSMRGDLVGEILGFWEFDRLIEEMSTAQGNHLVAQLRSLNPDLDAEAERKIRAAFADFFGGLEPEMLDLLAELVTQHYTEEEQEELLAYYRSDVGRKSLGLLPQLINEMYRTMPNLIADHSGTISEPRYSEVTAELFHVMRYEQLVEQSGIAAADRLIAEMRASNPDLDSATESQIRESILSDLQDGLPRMMEFVDEFLTEHFSLDEQRAMLAYAKSDLGQKSINLTPVMTGAVVDWLARLMQGERFWRFVTEIMVLAGVEHGGSTD